MTPGAVDLAPFLHTKLIMSEVLVTEPLLFQNILVVCPICTCSKLRAFVENLNTISHPIEMKITLVRQLSAYVLVDQNKMHDAQ